MLGRILIFGWEEKIQDKRERLSWVHGNQVFSGAIAHTRTKAIAV